MEVKSEIVSMYKDLVTKKWSDIRSLLLVPVDKKRSELCMIWFKYETEAL